MHSIRLLALLALVSLVPLHAAVAEDCAKILITASPKYPPLSWQDTTRPDTLVGVLVEMAERAFAELGVETEVVYAGPWKRTLFELKHDNYDVVAGLYYNDERNAYLDYVEPPMVMDKGVVFVIKGKEFLFTGWDDLISKHGGAILGDSRGQEFDAYQTEHLALSKVTNVKSLFLMLESGRIDYMLYGYNSGLANAVTYGFEDKITALPMEFNDEGMYLAFSRTSSCLQYKDPVSKILQRYNEEHLADELLGKYLDLWREQSSMEEKVD